MSREHLTAAEVCEKYAIFRRSLRRIGIMDVGQAKTRRFAHRAEVRA